MTNFKYNKINHRLNNDPIIQKKVNDLTKEDLQGVTRGGIIPYRAGENAFDGTLFLFGVDAEHNEITDLGGRIELTKDVDVIDTALREFHEESLGIFGPNPIKRELILDCTAFVSKPNHMLVIMAHMPLGLKVTTDEFDKIYQIKKENKEEKIEVKQLLWLSTTELSKIVNDEISKDSLNMFDLVKKFLISINTDLTTRL